MATPVTITDKTNSFDAIVDSSGLHVVVDSGGSGGNSAASATGAAVPANADYTGVNIGGTLRGQTGVNPSGVVYAAATDITSVGGQTVGAAAPGTAMTTAFLTGAKYTAAGVTLADGQQAALQADAAGFLKVNVAAGSSGNGAASNTGAAVPAQADYGGVNIGGTLRGRTAVNPSGTVYAAQTDITSIAGATVLVGHGVASGALRVELPTDGTGLVNANVDSVTDGVAFTGTAASAATLITLNTAGFAYIAFQFTSIGAGNQIIVESSEDGTPGTGTTFITAPIWKMENLVPGSFGAVAPTLTGVFLAPVVAATMRIRVSTYGSGTVTLNGTQKRSAPPLQFPVVYGQFNTTPTTNSADGAQRAFQVDQKGNLNVNLVVGNGTTSVGMLVDNSSTVAATGTTNSLKVINRNTITDTGANWQLTRQVVNAADTTGVGIQAVGVLAQLDDTSPSTVTENQFGNVRMAGDRSLLVSNRAVTGTLTNVASSASSVTILAANVLRKGATVFNDSTQILYLELNSAAASTTNYTLQLAANAYYEVPFGYVGQLTGIWASANGNARVTELA